MFKTIFLSTTKFEETIKIWGMTAPEFTRVCESGQNRPQKVSHWSLHDCAGRGRHSENLFLIHNMNRICRLC